MERQNNNVTADRQYFPFTTKNPYLPWYQQLKLDLFGESVIKKTYKDSKLWNTLIELLKL